jgi:thymidine phosphorylase
MVASVLSKKIAAGSTHVLIDIRLEPLPKFAAHKPQNISPIILKK